MKPIKNILVLIERPLTAIAIHSMLKHKYSKIKFFIGSINESIMNVHCQLDLIFLEAEDLHGLKTKAKQIRKNHPKAKILLISVIPGVEVAIELVKIGIQGCISPFCNVQEVISALQKIENGELYFG